VNFKYGSSWGGGMLTMSKGCMGWVYGKTSGGSKGEFSSHTRFEVTTPRLDLDMSCGMEIKSLGSLFGII
jgi:hypothetical protein